MVSLILEHKVAILIASEIIFIAFAFLALLLRYWFRMRKASLVAFIIVVLNEIALFAIGVLDYIEVGVFSQFQLLVLIFILYALLFGKSDFKKMDRWIQKKVARIKGEPVPDFGEDSRELYGSEHAKKERQGFYKHLLVFVIAQAVFYVLTKFNLLANTNVIAEINNVWTKIVVIDFIWSFSYTIWPKQKKQ